MNTNSENPKAGKAFQEMVCKSVPEDTIKVLGIKKATHSKKQETLAEYSVCKGMSFTGKIR